MCVVKTFSTMQMRRDHRNSTKDLGNCRKQEQKEGREGGKKGEILEVRGNRSYRSIIGIPRVSQHPLSRCREHIHRLLRGP